jgi:hypothetical protein
MVSQILVVMIAAIAVTIFAGLEASHPVDGAMKHTLNHHAVSEDVVEDVVRLVGK